MKKTILFLIFIVTIFFINIVFYFLSNDYKVFLKGLKGSGNLESINGNNKTESIDGAFKNLESIKTNKKNEEYFEVNEKTEEIELKNEVVLGQNYMDIIKIFSIYNLDKLEINTSLFDITEEYPDKYFEYYSSDLTLYLFPTKTYSEIFDIFKVLELDLPIEINEVNNFGNNSFFINLNKDIEDSFVRTIIENEGIVLGLKIKKTEYNLVKEKLNSFKK